MFKVKSLAVYSFILALLSTTYYLDEAILWSGGTEEEANYKAVTFDALNEKDMDLIDAVKKEMTLAE